MTKKTMQNIIQWVLIGAASGYLAGCTSTSGTGGSQGLASDQQGYEYDTRGADSFGLDQNSGIAAQGAAVGSTSNRIIYFDFDSASVRSDAMPVIEAHAQYLISNPSVAIFLEGHADERGTREYNIGLGDQRGEAVRRLLVARGVSAQQISVVSYGEERPAVAGQDDFSYSQNRRVEIVY
jgi:peptidoglycan-associated lipoprotein